MDYLALRGYRSLVTTSERYTALLRSLSATERLERALALSALARWVAWEGARRDAEGNGEEAVRARFLEKLYGARIAEQISNSLGARTANG